jgi:hypothetical protein
MDLADVSYGSMNRNALERPLEGAFDGIARIAEPGLDAGSPHGLAHAEYVNI